MIPQNPERPCPRSHVDEVEPGEGLRQAGDDGAVALGVVVELEKRRRHQLVVPGHREVGLLLQLDQEQLAVLPGPRDVGRDVGVLGRLEVWSPPVTWVTGSRSKRSRRSRRSRRFRSQSKSCLLQ